MEYQNKAAARESFTDLIRKKPNLEALADSQVMQGLNTFQGLALEYALHKLERAQQEGYLSTAYNRSSILALAEDRQYLPRKPTPSKGQLKVENKGSTLIGTPAHFALVSEDQRYYITDDAVSVVAGGSSLVGLTQVRKHTIDFVVEKEQPFLEFELGRSISKNIHKFRVFVDIGSGFEEWKPSVRFRNARDSKVFDEFYSHTDQVGIRFGNNVFGLIPKKDSKIKVELWLTDADTKLMPNQTLTAIDTTGVELAEFTTATVIQGGISGESTDELRRNAMYYPLYDENHVWGDDYAFFIKRHFPQVIWCKIWGEAEQEKMDGRLDLRNHNKIFFCCYAPNEPDIGTKIKPFMEKHIPQLNRRYESVPVDEQKFKVTIAGKVKRSVVLSDAIKLINDKLWNNYHKDSRTRRVKCLERDLYRICNSLNIFEELEDIHITITGTSEPANLKQMVFIDYNATVLDLSYNRGY